LAGLGLVYGLALATFLFLAVGISARATSSRSALVNVLALWVGMALVLPRVANSVAELAAPVLDREGFEREVVARMASGLPGQGGREARVSAITEALLEREGFAGAETLMDPSLLAGLELQAEAQYENEVLDQLHAERAQQLERREQLLRWFSLAAPPLALQSSSAALAGTNHAHHRHFADAAEQHRRALIEMLNRAFAESGGADGWSYRAGRETWATAPTFDYQPPTLSWSLASQRVQLVSLGLWCVGSLVFAAWASSRVKAV
jgi:ABC-2 type transport system permease protein